MRISKKALRNPNIVSSQGSFNFISFFFKCGGEIITKNLDEINDYVLLYQLHKLLSYYNVAR